MSARWRLPLAILLVAFLAAELGHRAQVLAPLENIYSDLWHRIAGVRYAPRHVALVAVDDASLAQYPDVPLAFWTPLFARALATLREAGVSVIGLDFNYQVTAENWIRNVVPDVAALKDYDLPFRQELNAGRVVLVGAVARGEGGAPDSLLLPVPDHLLALPEMNLVAGIGLADLRVDPDGVVRQYELSPQLNLPKDVAQGAPRHTLAALLALRASGEDPGAPAWRVGAQTLSPGHAAAISFAGPPGAVPRVPIARLLAPDALKDPAVRALKGKAVIVGGDFLGMNDVHATPYSGSVLGRTGALMTGPEIQANIAETLLSGRATRPLHDAWRWLLFALLIGAGVFAFHKLSPWFGLAVLATAGLAAFLAGYAAFLDFWLVPAAHAQLGVAAGYVMAFGSRLTREEREKARQRAMFEGYVSESVIEMYLSSDRKIDMGGQSMHITVLFSDIRSFTTITEKLDAHEVVEFLNAYFERAIEAIRDEGGRIDKFIGDAVMAEFGVPQAFPDHALRALRTAVRMRAIAGEFRGWMRARFADRGIPDFGIGIGVHTGNAVVGNLGSRQRMEFTAIGDTVNVASRLEGETKALNCVIVASADTVRAAGERVKTGRRETLKVKGRAEPVEVYEILDVAD